MMPHGYYFLLLFQELFWLCSGSGSGSDFLWGNPVDFHLEFKTHNTQGHTIKFLTFFRPNVVKRWWSTLCTKTKEKSLWIAIKQASKACLLFTVSLIFRIQDSTFNIQNYSNDLTSLYFMKFIQIQIQIQLWIQQLELETIELQLQLKLDLDLEHQREFF